VAAADEAVTAASASAASPIMVRRDVSLKCANPVICLSSV
jgi:hypothetical protein